MLLGLLCSLFMKYMDKNEIDHAIEIEKKCRDANVTYRAPMLSACVKLWTATKNANDAINDLEKLQNDYPSFKVGEYRIVDLMTLLINEDRLEKAYEILNNSSRGNPDFHQMSSNIRQLFSAVSDYAIRNNITENMSQQMLDVLLKKGFCRQSSDVLAAVIKEYLDRKEMQKAIKTYEEFARKYHVSPHSIKLLTILIEISNGTENAIDSSTDFGITKEQAAAYLHQIIDILKSLYNVNKVNVTTLMAFACAGTDQQLRKILMDPSIRIDIVELENGLEYLKSNGQIDAIIAIARLSRELPYKILNEGNLYDFLISHFEQTNDFKTAIQFYKEFIKDGGYQVSSKFNRIFRNLLKRNNQILPEYLNESGVAN